MPGAGRKDRRPHRFGVLLRHVDHPLVQIGRAGVGSRTASTVRPERLRQRIGHARRGRVSVGVRGEQRTPDRISRWISAPLGVLAATVSTPRNSSG